MIDQNHCLSLNRNEDQKVRFTPKQRPRNILINCIEINKRNFILKQKDLYKTFEGKYLAEDDFDSFYHDGDDGMFGETDKPERAVS